MSFASRLPILPLLVVAVACAPDAPQLHGEPWPEANALFTGDSSWIGGDGAYSVDLGGGRVLWLFGDSFIATSPARKRDQSFMVRNSVALQTGYDPTRAFMRFYYGHGEDHPQSFVPEDGIFWFWPGHGIRRGERALLFYGRLYQATEGMWGFATAAWSAFVVDNPDDEPSAWQMHEADVDAESGDGDMSLGGAVLEIGEHLYVYGHAGEHHDLYLSRFETERAMAGDLTSPEWWNGSHFGAFSEREPLLTLGAPEYSIHYAAPLGRYVYTETAGAGASTIAIRTADAPEGPWSEARDVMRPPESYLEEPFVYAGKAHPELRGADLAATYVPSAYEDGPPDPAEVYYYPRFLRIGYR
jgi:hypothetical protein